MGDSSTLLGNRCSIQAELRGPSGAERIPPQSGADWSQSRPQSLRESPEAMRAYKRQWIAARRKAWFDANGPCVRCGATQHLELDHINPALKVHHAIWSWSKERRDAETAKCQVLCRGCHQKKTIEDRYPERKHGDVAMYKRGRCRCDLCRAANSLYRWKLRRQKAGLSTEPLAAGRRATRRYTARTRSASYVR